MTNAQATGTKLNRAGIFRIITILAFTAFQIVTFFIAAGDPGYIRGWIYFGVNLGYFFFAMFYFFLSHPDMVELVNERGKFKPDNKWWDKVFMAVYTPVFLFTPVVGGLDAVRFGWSRLGEAWVYPGIALFLGSGILVDLAMRVNRHFEVGVRLQKDRGHAVVSSGPYAYIRHPGYLGMIGMISAFPLIVGSAWSFVSVGLIAIFLLIRTGFEDRMLRKELPGYAEYAARVRFRLIPYVW